MTQRNAESLIISETPTSTSGTRGADLLARSATELDRNRRVARERAQVESESLRRARETESVRSANEQLRRDVAELVAREAAGRELQMRLEADQRARADAQIDALRREETLAELRANAGRGRGSYGVAGLFVALAFAAVGTAGFVARAQIDTAREIAAAAQVTPAFATTSTADLDALRATIRENDARAARADAERVAVEATHRNQRGLAPTAPHIQPRSHPPTTATTVDTLTRDLDHGIDPVNTRQP